MAAKLLYDADGTGEFQVYLADLDGTSPVQVTFGSTWDSWFPQGSPGGDWFAFVRSPAGEHDSPGPPYDECDLWRARNDGTDPELLIDHTAVGWEWLSTPHYSPAAGQLVLARRPTGAAIRPTVVDAEDGSVIGDLDFDAGSALLDPSWHPDISAGGTNIGRVVYCRQGSLVRRDWDFVGATPSGARTTLFDATAWNPNVGDPDDQGEVTCYDPRYSPDGTLVAFLCDFNGFADIDPLSDLGVAACDADGTSPYRVTPDDHIYSRPEWSSDGVWIYCHRFNAGWEIVRVPSDGSAVATPGLVEVLVTGDYSEYPSEWDVEDPPPEDPECPVQYLDTFERTGDLVGSDTDSGFGWGDPQEWGALDAEFDSDSPVIVSGTAEFPSDFVFDGPSGTCSATLPCTGLEQVVLAVITSLPAILGDAVVLGLRARATATGFCGVLVGADGQLGLFAVRDGFADDTDSAPPGTINDGDFIALWCVGSTVTLRVNDTIVATVTDPDPEAEYVSLIFAGLAAAPTETARVQDFVVYSCEPEGEPPVAEDSDVAVCADEATAIPLDATDADLDALTCTIDTPPTNGSLGAVVDCAVTYTPDPGYTGPDSFTWHANDGTDDSNIATVTITVVDCEEPPDDGGTDVPAVERSIPPGPCGDPPLHVAPTRDVLGPASRCAETRVEIRRRGSHAPILQLDSGDEMIERYEWNRAMGATAPAQVVVPLGGSVDLACCRVLGSLTPWRDEVLIYRDEDLVWEGPLHVAREIRDRVVLDARDPSAWAEVRRVRRRHTFVERDAAEAWAQVFADGLSADWPAGLELRMTRACALVTRTVEPLPYLLAAGPMGEIAADGVDWTAFGSTILVGGTCTNVILDVTLYDDAFAGSPEVAPDGAAYASWVGVNGEGDVVAEAGGTDADIGLVERVFDDRGARDERTARQHAQRSWAVRGREGVPVIVSMAQDVALSGRAPLGVNDLVCGRMLRVAIQPACREVATLMRLVAVKVTGDADGEKIVPTLEPVGDAGGLNG